MKIIPYIFWGLFTTITATLLSTQPPSTNQQWKDDLQKKFTAHLTYIRTIIDHGETSEEIKDFAQHFTQLENWFKTTLTQLASPADKPYEQIKAKVDMLIQLVDAQKSAEATLKSMLHDATTIAEALPLLRLSLLYEINLLLTKNINVHEAALTAAQHAAQCIPEKEGIAKLENIIELNLKACNEEKKALKHKLVNELEKTYKEKLALQAQALENAKRFSIIQEQAHKIKLGAEQGGATPLNLSEPEQAQRAFIELELTQSSEKEEQKK
jgi:hypothetical protein